MKTDYPHIDSYTATLHGQEVAVKVFAPQVSPDVSVCNPTSHHWENLSPRAPGGINFRAIHFDGRIQTLRQWATEFDIGHGTLARRLRSGWPVREALTIPVASKGAADAA